LEWDATAGIKVGELFTAGVKPGKLLTPGMNPGAFGLGWNGTPDIKPGDTECDKFIDPQHKAGGFRSRIKSAG